MLRDAHVLVDEAEARVQPHELAGVRAGANRPARMGRPRRAEARGIRGMGARDGLAEDRDEGDTLGDDEGGAQICR